MNKLLFSCLNLHAITCSLIFSLFVNFSFLYGMSPDEGDWFNGTYNGTYCMCKCSCPDLCPDPCISCEYDEWGSWRSALTYTALGAVIGFIPYIYKGGKFICRRVPEKMRRIWNGIHARFRAAP